MNTKMKTLNKNRNIFEKISFIIGISLSFLLPIFVIPIDTFSVVVSKNLILFLGVMILFFLWGFEKLKNKDFLITKNILVISSCLILFSYFFSALFSKSIYSGMMGVEFEISTFCFIFCLFALMFFVARTFKFKIQVLYLYTGLIVSAFLMMTVHILRLFIGSTFLSFGVLNNLTSNLLGSWNELGIFFGLISIISLLINEYLDKSKFIKIFSFVSLGLSLFFVWLVNFKLVVVFLMLISFFIIVYGLFFDRNKKEKINYNKLYKKTSVYVFIITLVFILVSGSLKEFNSSSFEISNFEVRPSLTSTLSIIKPTLASTPFLGAGPNAFANQWSIYKPEIVNETEFWNVDFNTGFSFLLTSIVTVGLLGFISWILFIGFILYLGFKLLKKFCQNDLERFIALSLFSSSLYLTLFLIFYIPGIVILALTFLIWGVMISFLQQSNIIQNNKVSFGDSNIKKIFIISLILVILGINLFVNFLFFKKVDASVSYNKGFIAINKEQDFIKGYELIMDAASKYSSDLYFRSLTDLNLMQLEYVLSQENISDEVLKDQFQEVLSTSINSGQKAVQIDSNNYLNLITLANVYGSVVPLQLEGAYEKALNIYLEAVRLNPTNPFLVLNLANLEIANRDLEKAERYIEVAIQMKNNYSDAYYLLSQLKFSEGNTEEAFKIIEDLSLVNPDDPELFLQLGVFNYEKADYEKAKSFLERALILSPYYPNAKYLLGLTYDFIGEKEKAIEQFNDLKVLNPNNENVEIILNNIESGRNPFYGFEQAQPISEIIQEESNENQLTTEEDTFETNTEEIDIEQEL